MSIYLRHSCGVQLSHTVFVCRCLDRLQRLLVPLLLHCSDPEVVHKATRVALDAKNRHKLMPLVLSEVQIRIGKGEASPHTPACLWGMFNAIWSSTAREDAQQLQGALDQLEHAAVLAGAHSNKLADTIEVRMPLL